MIKSTKNQLGNALNPSQGSDKKVLTVCSAGLLRSATLQNYLIKHHGYNVRNCGSTDSFALIPLSEALVHWADEIVFVETENYNESGLVKQDTNLRPMTKVIILDVPDYYGYNDPKLINIMVHQYLTVQEEIKKYPNERVYKYDITKLEVDE